MLFRLYGYGLPLQEPLCDMGMGWRLCNATISQELISRRRQAFSFITDYIMLYYMGGKALG